MTYPAAGARPTASRRNVTPSGQTIELRLR